MKKITNSAILLLLVFALFPQSIFANFGIKVNVNGNIVNFEIQEPIIVDGRTLVPISEVFEAMGFYVLWDEINQAVTISDGFNSAFIGIGQNHLIANGEQTIEMDVPAQIINGRTMLPLRAVSEAVGANVNWNTEQRLADISYNKPSLNLNILVSAPLTSPEYIVPSIYHNQRIASNRLLLWLHFPSSHIENDDIVNAIASIGGAIVGNTNRTRSLTIQVPPRSETDLTILGEHILSEFPHIFYEYEIALVEDIIPDEP